MPSQSSGCSNVLECCLHGRVCRAGQKDAEDKNKEQEASEQYVNLATSKNQNQRKSQENDAEEKLARQLRQAEQQVETSRRRREENRTWRSEEQNLKDRSRPLKDSTDSDISYRQIDGDGFSGKSPSQDLRKIPRNAGFQTSAMDGTINVSVPRTPDKKSKNKPKEDRNQMVSDKEEERRVSKASEADSSSSPDNYNDLARSIYLGVCNFSKAEEMVQKRADFRLYHEMVQNPLLDDLEPELPLNLVYKTANGSYRHYPVRTRSVFESTYFYVETGEKRPIKHCSLNHLVRYYQINAQRHPDHKEYADAFPWWEVSSTPWREVSSRN